ncbi:hypothetical protein M8C21_025390 [Ambrosia artemisiifolia]|uniref:Uncharacterized protein n=1 Tax=Ambrosia artemisiifolia TaxID=4212 RepID=A0AAD5GA50_AMBAR|nr:hypothetical protein M8C21_025390 [Ambrosia artemisiifolia]
MDCSLNSPELGPLDKASSVAEDAMENTPELDPLDKAPLIFVDDVPKFQMKTLPVLEKGVTDECLLNVFVEVKEFSLLPMKILIMLNQCRKALANGEDCLAQELLNQLKMGEYEIVDVDDVKCLTKKYQIKIRGINALDIGVKTREKLVEMVDGKQLTVVVYCFDDSGKHWVGDVYCDGICLLEKLCGSEALRD